MSHDYSFESSIVGKHYQSKRSMAAAYLMTCGSKALMVADSLMLDEDNDVLTMMQALDEESAIKRDIIHQEEAVKSSRRLNHNLTSQSGIVVLKRGRNGKTRRIRLKLISTKTDGDCLAWKSNLVGGEKLFALSTLTSITLLKEEEDDKIPSSAVPSAVLAANDSNKNASKVMEVPWSFLNDASHSSSPVNMPSQFIRFHNESRNLDVQFLSELESQACIRFLSSYIHKT